MAQDHLKSPMVKRRGRRRRPSLDNLLRQHSEEIALGVGLAPDEEELQDDDKRGLKALFELVGNGSEHLRVGHINPFLEKLGVFMDSGKVSDLFKLHQLQLSPAEAEALEAGGKKAAGEGLMDIPGFKKMLEMIQTSGDGGGDGLEGLGDSTKPNHKMKADDVKKLQRIFNAVDIDNDKALNQQEIVVVFKKWGLDDILESEILELISRFDVNNSGTLDFDEFLALATAAKALCEGEDEDMELVIKTHFAREHAKVRALAVRQRLSVDAATLLFFKNGEATTNTVRRVPSTNPGGRKKKNPRSLAGRQGGPRRVERPAQARRRQGGAAQGLRARPPAAHGRARRAAPRGGGVRADGGDTDAPLARRQGRRGADGPAARDGAPPRARVAARQGRDGPPGRGRGRGRQGRQGHGRLARGDELGLPRQEQAPPPAPRRPRGQRERPGRARPGRAPRGRPAGQGPRRGGGPFSNQKSREHM